MEKYLLTFEFRYSDAPKHDDDYTNRNKTITIGVYDDFENACKEGNKNLEILEDNFKLNPNYNRKERFSKNGGCFGSKKNLITNLAYLKTPFEFYAKITTLRYDSIGDTIDIVIDSVKRYRNFKAIN